MSKFWKFLEEKGDRVGLIVAASALIVALVYIFFSGNEALVFLTTDDYTQDPGRIYSEQCSLVSPLTQNYVTFEVGGFYVIARDGEAMGDKSVPAVGFQRFYYTQDDEDGTSSGNTITGYGTNWRGDNRARLWKCPTAEMAVAFYYYAAAEYRLEYPEVTVYPLPEWMPQQ
jgi:hypothetical protein